MVAATRQPRERLCTACFTGAYPVPLPDEQQLGKGVLELQLAFDEVDLPAAPSGEATDEGPNGGPRVLTHPTMSRPTPAVTSDR